MKTQKEIQKLLQDFIGCGYESREEMIDDIAEFAEANGITDWGDEKSGISYESYIRLGDFDLAIQEDGGKFWIDDFSL